MAGKKILLVDDEPTVGRSVQMLLSLEGHQVEFVISASKALEKYRPGWYDLVITDHRMPGMSGLELAQQLKIASPGQPIMMLTGFPPPEPIPGVDLLLLKPFSGTELWQAVAKLTGG